MCDRDRATYVVTVLAAAGVGKTRLALEFKRSVADRADVVIGRCRPTGQGTTWLPVAQVLEQIGRLLDAPAAAQAVEREADLEAIQGVVAELTSEGEIRAAPEEISWVLRTMVAAAARQRPLVVVLEDIHWADPTLLELIEHTAEWSRDAPLLLLICAGA